MNCPICDSSNIKTHKEIKHHDIVVGKGFQYEEISHECLECGEVGQFDGQTDKNFKVVYEQANKNLNISTLENLKNYYSYAYVEKALQLPYRSLSQWKSTGDCTAAASALLKIISSFPFVVEAADAKYDPKFCMQLIFNETAKYIGQGFRLMNDSPVEQVVIDVRARNCNEDILSFTFDTNETDKVKIGA